VSLTAKGGADCFSCNDNAFSLAYLISQSKRAELAANDVMAAGIPDQIEY